MMNQTRSDFELEGMMQENLVWEIRGPNQVSQATPLLKALHIGMQARAGNQIVDSIVLMPKEKIVILPDQIHRLTKNWRISYSG